MKKTTDRNRSIFGHNWTWLIEKTRKRALKYLF